MYIIYLPPCPASAGAHKDLLASIDAVFIKNYISEGYLGTRPDLFAGYMVHNNSSEYTKNLYHIETELGRWECYVLCSGSLSLPNKISMNGWLV